jgi:hypothetical protein
VNIKRVNMSTAIQHNEDGELETDEIYSYVLQESPPNVDGYYEIPRSVHFVYPAMVAQNLLKEAGYTYVGAKKGDYDTELWYKEIPSPEVALPSGVIVHQDDAKELERLDWSNRLRAIRQQLVILVAELDEAINSPVVTGLSNAQETGGSVETTPDTTPTPSPHLAGKYGPVDGDWWAVGVPSKPPGQG